MQAFVLAQQALPLTAPSPWANTFARPSAPPPRRDYYTYSNGDFSALSILFSSTFVTYYFFCSEDLILAFH